MISTFIIITTILGSLCFLGLVAFIIYITTTLKNKSCPTLTYTGSDIENPEITELTCSDIIRGFGPELASLSGKDAAAQLTCDDFQEILNSDSVKEILHVDSIPENFCSSSCCDSTLYTPTSIACILTDSCSEDTNMCVNGIEEENGWRCDLGRSFESVGGNTVKDSWTGGLYTGELYGEGQLENATNICCTEQKKEGLE